MGGTFEPFLTELDRRAEVKGSRDPLGIQSIWARFGRHVVGNLTTVSNSLRDFTTLLLGYYLAEKVADEVGPGTELSTFLKWEQLAAYARLRVNGDANFRGVERTKWALSEGRRVTLSAARQHQILSNQKTYGLWGLYSVPAAASSLVQQDPPALTPRAREFVERVYLPLLRKEGAKAVEELVALLAKGEVRIDIDESNRFVRAAARLLNRRVLTAEKEFYRSHLVAGGPEDSTGGLQERLAVLLVSDAFRSEPLSPQLLNAMAKEAATGGSAGETLAERLGRIRVCESVVAPAAHVYDHMLGLDGKSPDSLARRLREHWGPAVKSVQLGQLEELRAELAGGDAATGERWIAIGEALSGGDYQALIELLTEQNRSVMAARGGAAWLLVENGKFLVRFRYELGLPAKDDLPRLWRHPYFIESLRGLTRQLGGD